MAKNTTNLTRRDYVKEKAREIWHEFDSHDDVDAKRFLGDIDEYAKQQADTKLEMEDERIWAFHRDPQTDLTQVEARNRAQEYAYPDRYQISQSSVSRKLRKLDRDMLVEPVKHWRMKERTGPEKEAGLMCPILYKTMGKKGFSDYLDTYRAIVARFMIDWLALRCFNTAANPTPEWAIDRFPELDPDIGRKYLLRMGEAESEVHAPTESTQTAANSD